jgi:hypothetical protein
MQYFQKHAKLKIDSVDQKFNWLECGNFSQDSGTSGTEGVIAFSQLAVKGLMALQASTSVISAHTYNLPKCIERNVLSCKNHRTFLAQPDN